MSKPQTDWLDLGEPKIHQLPITYVDGEGEHKKLMLLLRGFPLADTSWLQSECGVDWWDKVVGGDMKLAIHILAHQIENLPEVVAKIGEPAERLPKLITRRESNVKAIVRILGDMYADSVPRSMAKKKILKAVGLITMILSGYLCGVLTADLVVPIFSQ